MRRSDREISDSQEVEEIIKKADVCRIAIANNNMPYIVTMNFGFIRDPEPILYFHSAKEGKKLDMIRKNNYVCFEMDTDHLITKGTKGCNWGMKFSSILGYGKIFMVNDEEEKIKGLNTIMSHYGGEKENIFDNKVFEQTAVLRLEIQEMTGKKK